MNAEKGGYRVEFTRYDNGKKKVLQNVPQMGVMDTFLLVPSLSDETFMRDRLSWELYNAISGKDIAFDARKTSYAELFINGTYEGLYLVLEPYQIADELSKDGDKYVLTDSVYRTSVEFFVGDKPTVSHPLRELTVYESYYKADVGTLFEALSAYIDLICESEDNVFIQKAARYLDMDSLIRMDLLFQIGGMTDNVFNNLYIRAKWTGTHYVYSFAPWDMDMTWGLKREEIGDRFENWLFFPLLDRLLALDALKVRDKLVQQWIQLRKSIATPEWIYAQVSVYAQELDSSGAMARNAERWGEGLYAPDEETIMAFVSERIENLDEAISRIADGEADFLACSEYDGEKGVSIYIADE